MSHKPYIIFIPLHITSLDPSLTTLPLLATLLVSLAYLFLGYSRTFALVVFMPGVVFPRYYHGWLPYFFQVYSNDTFINPLWTPYLKLQPALTPWNSLLPCSVFSPHGIYHFLTVFLLIMFIAYYLSSPTRAQLLEERSFFLNCWIVPCTH